MRKLALIIPCLFVFTTHQLCAEITITLNNSFIEQFKNKVTILAAYVVDKAHKQPNPPAKDADIHIAGRSADIGLPVVAEIMNAKGQPKALTLVHKVEGSDETINVTGVWRIWCEHGGDTEFVQGAALQKFDTTNPPHVFELHPLLKLNDIDVTAGFKRIVGFQAKDADQAFLSYERTRSEIVVGEATTTIRTVMAGFNYVDFRMRLNQDPHPVEDGTMVMATVLNTEGEELVHNRRMVFAAGTAPDNKIKALKKGSELHVLGIPRIDLALVSFRVTKSAEDASVLKWSLPYEMIVVALLP